MPQGPDSRGEAVHARRVRSRSLARVLLLGFGVPALLITSVSLICLQSIRQSTRAGEEVQHTLVVMETIGSLETALADSISARRGHSLTGEEVFAEKFAASAAQADTALKRLAELVADNPQQAVRVQGISSLVGRRLARRRELIELKKHGRLPASTEPEVVAEGQTMADTVRDSLREIRAAESQLLEQRKAAANAAGRRALLLIGLAMALMLATLIPAARGIWVAFHAREEAEERVREQASLLELILESLSDGVAVADTHGKFLVFNRAAQDLTGQGAVDLPPSEWSRAYATYVPWSNEIVPAEDLPLPRAMRGEVVDDALVEIRRADGQCHALLQVSGRPLRDISGELRGGVVVFRDVQERYRIEQERQRLSEELEARVRERTAELARVLEDLRRSEAEVLRTNQQLEERVRQRTAELEQVNKELEAFTYSTSHDLRAPLRHITGFARILAEDHGSRMTLEARHLLARIEQGGRNMGRLIDDLLHLSRMGRQPLLKAEVNLDVLATAARDECMRSANGRQIAWHLAPLGTAQCDAVLVKQVFLNLLSNAVKFTSTRESAQISVGRCGQNGEAVYFIRDNGVGFSMSTAKKLFGVFQRLHRQEEFEGTGVGLAIVQRIVQRHGGRVWAEAEPERGATFFFSLGATMPVPTEVVPEVHEPGVAPVREAADEPGGNPAG